MPVHGFVVKCRVNSRTQQYTMKADGTVECETNEDFFFKVNATSREEAIGYVRDFYVPDDDETMDVSIEAEYTTPFVGVVA